MTFYIGFGKIAKLLIFILKITFKKFAKYLLVLINTFEEDEIGDVEQKNMRKSENKIVKLLAKSKSWNLYKFRFRSLFKSKKT